MTILPSDIKLRESERMTDTPDGGGRRTNRLVVDGVAGNVFPKVSRVDSVYGRVNFRKLYGHVDTINTDMYAGAHAIITDAPDNNRIHVCAFATGSDFDNRTAARDRVESFVIMGPEARMTLYGIQLVNSMALLAYQRVGEPLPEIGEVFALLGPGAVQYFRLQDLKHIEATFTDGQGNFTVNVLTMGLSAPLLTQFNGIDTPSRISAEKGESRIRTTRVADAARYFGIQPLLNAANLGDLTMLLPSVYTYIVPTTTRETGVTLASPGAADAILAASTVKVTEEFLPGMLKDAGGAASSTMYLTRPVLPGSVSMYVAPGLYGVDDGLGNIKPTGTFSSITIDYGTGTLTVNYPLQYWNNFYPRVEYTPACPVEQAAHTQSIDITIGTRGSVYTPALLPIPASGTLIVDYRALGKWYRLRDDGTGVLKGADPSYGTGTVNFATGGTIITLGALPDVGSSILLGWGSPVHYEILTALPASEIDIQLDTFPVRKTSLLIKWTTAGVEKTAVDNGVGVITGHATGTIEYSTGKVKLNVGAALYGALAITYDETNAPVESPNPNLGGAVLQFTVTVNGVKLTFPDGSTSLYSLSASDHGDGKLIAGGYYWGTETYIQTNGYNSYYIPSNLQIGEVSYATGGITMAPSVPCTKRYYREWDDSYQNEAGVATLSLVNVTYQGTKSALAVVSIPKTQSVSIGVGGVGLSLKLAPLKPMLIMANSLLFTAFGKKYIDRNGSIYSDVSAATGSGFLCGSINYETGAIELDQYPAGTAPVFTVIACLGKRGSFTSSSVFFRTAGAPLRPASTYLQCTALDGELLSASTNQNGDFIGASIVGNIDQVMGVAKVEFGMDVTTNNVTEWVPRQVMPETVRYSSVVISNLPLSSAILGLDPVRLPSDGRVPIYRPADVAVVHHTDIHDLGTPEPGSTHSMGRIGLSMLWVQDALGVKLPASKYTVNLDAGTLTIAADAVFTGYALPLNARHRIEEMGLLTDVQINGQITLAAPLLRNYPMGSFVSSALLFGDLFARVTGVHDLNTFAGWTDVPGGQATAQFNDVDFPIEVLNDAATSERWRLNFTSPTTYQIIGEQLGVIATGSTTVDMQPINILTGKAYFTIRKNGFGAGWSTGNQLRFNTVGATPPFWLCRTVLPGATLAGDSFDAQLRGDVD